MFASAGKTARAVVHILAMSGCFSGVSGAGWGGCNNVTLDVFAFHHLSGCFSGVSGGLGWGGVVQ